MYSCRRCDDPAPVRARLSRSLSIGAQSSPKRQNVHARFAIHRAAGATFAPSRVARISFTSALCANPVLAWTAPLPRAAAFRAIRRVRLIPQLHRHGPVPYVIGRPAASLALHEPREPPGASVADLTLGLPALRAKSQSVRGGYSGRQDNGHLAGSEVRCAPVFRIRPVMDERIEAMSPGVHGSSLKGGERPGHG